MGSGSQQFCLKWNNHHSNMLNVFEHLLSSEALVDVTLACEGLSLKAHKMVLSACSPFFQSLFLENPCKHPIVILKDMRYADLKAIIDFMYRGEVNVSQNQLSALLKTAETLKVKGLAEVSGEDGQSNGSGVVQQEVVQQTVPQSTAAPTGGSATQGTTTPASGARAETPPLSRRKRGRPRRRSLSDSNRSDSEDQVPAKIREAESPEVIEDRDMDTSSSTAGAVEGSNGVQKLPLPLQTQTQPQSQVSRLAIDDATSGDEGDFLPSKLMEQSMTTENVPVFPESQTAGSTVSPTPSQRLMLGSSSLVERSMQGPSTSDSQALVPVSQSSEISGTGHSSQDIPEDDGGVKVKSELDDTKYNQERSNTPKESTLPFPHLPLLPSFLVPLYSTSSKIVKTREGASIRFLLETELEALYRRSQNARQFAVNIAKALFSPEEMRHSNCRGARDKRQLDNEKLVYIQNAVFGYYNVAPFAAADVWKVCCQSIDAHCRHERRLHKKSLIQDLSFVMNVAQLPLS